MKPPLVNTKTLTDNVSLQIVAGKIAEAQRDADVEWFMSQKGVKLSLDSALRFEREKAKAEVAREIFEEAEKYIKDHVPFGVTFRAIAVTDWQSLKSHYLKEG